MNVVEGMNIFFPDEGRPMALLNSEFSPGDGPIFLDSLECVGNEEKLIDCRRNFELGRFECSHDFEAGVKCPGTQEFYTYCNLLFIRLKNFHVSNFQVKYFFGVFTTPSIQITSLK